MKFWKQFGDECTRCGSSDVEVYTSAKDDGYAYDGDEARCNDCGLLGAVALMDEDEGTANINWNDYED